MFPTVARARPADANGTNNYTLAEGAPGPWFVSKPTPVNFGMSVVTYSFSSASGMDGVGARRLARAA